MNGRWILITFQLLICLACQNKSTTRSIDKTIYDSTKLLTADERVSLHLIINQIETVLGPRAAIIIIQSLKGESIENYSVNAMEQLKLGRDNYKDGILICLSIDDKKGRIEVGYGLEQIVSDESAARILREKIAPEFKRRKYFDGLKDGLIEIERMIKVKKQLIGKSLRSN